MGSVFVCVCSVEKIFDIHSYSELIQKSVLEFSYGSEEFREHKSWALLWFRWVLESIQKLLWKLSESVPKDNIFLKMFWFSFDTDWM